MNSLELKVPPVPLALAFGGAMWLASVQLSAPAFVLPGRIAVSTTLGGLGLIFAITGMVAFRNAMTTFNPMQPGAASVLVTSGAYRLSRNPMYVGLLLTLGGWAVFLSHMLAFLFLPAFVAYMNRFQISPEEAALSSKFGKEFAAYKQSVRRWL
ncbi:MAG: isoprenylcysteine carboxylmethyltransferase family protein [Rhodocyclaceae bacterium]|nr:MAG: isoprenylcysteine carboxylmethyltransferase family protein [Rhodocyclaceae bacterium]